ncbi:Similar to cc_bv1.2_33.1 [Cotesia congregata]|uniref:Similar to cc_bv1.2_33.1 n=1 Tax=Cotesia congregata TaxID=51543 RepID=A0A8J2HIH5_COTCN|nr:Similar to cc_bv1.2_33.1 [Cotesia congregata]
MMYIKALVFFFVATIGTVWTPGGSTRGLALARPSFFNEFVRDVSNPKFLDHIVWEIAEFRSQIPVIPGSILWVAEKGYLWMEKELNIPTNYGSKLYEIKRRNNHASYYVIKANDIFGPINIQHGNTINPVPSGGKLQFGPINIQKGNLYGEQKN